VYHAVGDHATWECAARRARAEVEVANADGDRTRGEPVPAQVGGGARDEGKQLAVQIVVARDVLGERLIARDTPRLAARFHPRSIDAAHAVVQPLALPVAEPSRECRGLVGQDVADGLHAELCQPFLKLRTNERQLGEREGGEELALVPRLDDVHAGSAGAWLRLGALDG